MAKISLAAKMDNLYPALDFIKEQALKSGLDEKKLMEIQLASEEVLVNIINYAYLDKEGKIEIQCSDKDGKGVVVEVVDRGKPFNPLELSEPDLTAPIEERRIGGLGIYLLRKITDEVNYQRKADKNILTFVKYNTEKSSAECLSRWPLSYMKRELYKKGEMLFKKGDKANKMFYIKKGSIRLIEINKTIGQCQVIGEMGIFSPFKERTASAICEEDLEVYTMGKDEVIRFFGHDPALAIDVMQTSIERFIENLKVETAARERMESELRIARDIQTSMLPQVFPPFPERKEFDIFAMMDPAKEVGGDFYDFFFIDENKLCVVIGDVSGKGIPAALFMAISKTLLKTEALRGIPPDEVIHRVNNIICPDNKACMFVTLFCMILNTATGELEFSNAGHNPPLICGRNRCFDFFNVPKGCVMGVIENSKFLCKKIKLSPGDVTFLYTDGVTEAMNPQNQLFSEGRLRESLENLKDKHKDIKDLIIGIRQELRVFAGSAVQSDDITMLALKYFGKGEK